ncbi:tetratricopeptide repeat protein [Ideonella sp. YS5]|uniref:tetratricopeptide repeat protein n=1 Tax=Ideonella sp. YS5 TaxID=3453714 RepID=UPI003EEF2790
MTTSLAHATYTLKRVQELLDLPRSVVTGLVADGFVRPARGPRNEYRFSFQDLLLLRTAHALSQANIAPRKILRALARLRGELPSDLPLTGLRVSAVGADVVVHDGHGARKVDSGQRVLDFEVNPAPRTGEVAFIDRRPEPTVAPLRAADKRAQAQAWFQQGERQEASNPKAAEAAYREAIALVPTYVDAYLNLGALLCEASRCIEAADLYEHALQLGAVDALIHFNHAIALEDQRDLGGAILSYRRALALDPDLADAHYNIGRLLEKQGDAQGALRHFSAYRRLAR